jgi:hypothetical protein
MSTNYSSQSNKTINVIIVKIIATITAPNSSAMLTILFPLRQERGPKSPFVKYLTTNIY